MQFYYLGIKASNCCSGWIRPPPELLSNLIYCMTLTPTNNISIWKAIWKTRRLLSCTHTDLFWFSLLFFFFRKTSFQCKRRFYLYYITPKRVQERLFNILSKDNLCCPSQHKGEGWGIIIAPIVRLGKRDEESEKSSRSHWKSVTELETEPRLFAPINTLITSMTISLTAFSHYLSGELATVLKTSWD